MPDNTIEWGQGAVNNTNDWGKAKANATNNFGAVYDDSPSGDTNIAGSTGAVLSITYSASAFCEDASDPTPTVSNNVGAGTFSSTAGLVFISTSTGEVDLSASTSGATYVITYTDTNSATATFSLTINDLDDASFAYSASSYSQSDADPTPTVTGLSGGTFSAGSGLVFVDSGSNTGSSTGEIDLSASTVASYTITYTTAGTCPNTSTQTVGITSALAQVNNVYSMEFDGNDDFININSLASALGSQGSFSAWVNVADWSSRTAILGFAFDADNFLRFGIRPDNNNCFSIGGQFNNVSHEVISDTTSLSENVWYHIVATSNGSVYKLYVNGQSQTLTIFAGSNNGSWVSDFSSTANKGTIGSLNRTGPSEDLFNGKIDEVSIFNVELTAQEVSSIYNATETGKTADLNDLTTPPIKWYRMGD